MLVPTRSRSLEGKVGREEKARTWDVQVSKAIASSASYHMGPTACALDISDAATGACGCTAERGHSCKEKAKEMRQHRKTTIHTLHRRKDNSGSGQGLGALLLSKFT